MTNDPYILVHAVAKSYGSLRRGDAHRVLKEFSLAVARYAFVTFFGPNGCGKSTLMKLIAGLDSLEEGTITIGGKPPSESRIGFVFQDFEGSLFPWRRNIDNVAFPLELRGVDRSERRRLASALLERFKISLPEYRYPYELSGGQKQLVVIARALIMQPDVLILDEPFAHLDFETKVAMQLKLMEMWEAERMTVLFVSHDVDEAVLLGDRIVVMTTAPSQVRESIDNPAPRPRSFDFLGSQSFFDVRARVLNSFGWERRQ